MQILFKMTDQVFEVEKWLLYVCHIIIYGESSVFSCFLLLLLRFSFHKFSLLIYYTHIRFSFNAMRAMPYEWWWYGDTSILSIYVNSILQKTNIYYNCVNSLYNKILMNGSCFLNLTFINIIYIGECIYPYYINMKIGGRGVKRKKKHTRAFGYYVKRKLNTLTSFPFSFKDVIAEPTDVWKWEMTWMKFGYGRKAKERRTRDRERWRRRRRGQHQNSVLIYDGC